ncbi:SDR family oxidoreductase [Salibacter halophilus]|uniref:dTDP-4-dehydrorhamnose reductase n=1 Tax=Salibacter halophilus TaxID=1803916 RepID=A0A6N6M1W3_9FLAO|nr:SDR family oxidoreductase [Salibacter halophilus]KAB1062703.1 SDR family oxidoreductase [Salibacter halophilus]
MKVLITGVNGLIGNEIAKEFFGKASFTVGTGRGAQRCKSLDLYVELDLEETSKIRSVLDQVKPDVIIHSGAISQVDVCEENKEKAFRINVQATKEIVSWCSDRNKRLVFFSSDFVYAGKSLSYDEQDFQSPVNYYGYTKMMAERCIYENLKNFSIIRPVLVYGLKDSAKRENIFSWLRKDLSDNKIVKIVYDQWRKPTYVDDVALATASIVFGKFTGSFNICGPQEYSVFGFAREIATILDTPLANILPVSGKDLNQAGDRPPITGFSCKRAKQYFNYNPRSLRDVFPEILDC